MGLIFCKRARAHGVCSKFLRGGGRHFKKVVAEVATVECIYFLFYCNILNFNTFNGATVMSGTTLLLLFHILSPQIVVPTGVLMHVK